MKVLLKNGYIVDGTGKDRYIGSIGIDNGIIITMGHIQEEYYDNIIDVKCNIIAPGFIDTHSHSDLKILEQPIIEPKLRQGITTELLGQDGISLAPLPKQYIGTWRKNISGLNGDSSKIEWDKLETADDYLNMLEKNGVGQNIGYLVPHGNIRMEVMGLENRDPNLNEIQHMKEITRRELKSGAFGVSTGLIYSPCCFSRTDELIEICKVVAEFDGVLAIHIRNETSEVISAINEAIVIAKKSGVKLHISHFKIAGRNSAHKIEEVLILLDNAKKEGLQFSFDQYPYIAASTMLSAVLPPWTHEGGSELTLKRLADHSQRKRIINDINKGIAGWENTIYDSGIDHIFITSIKTKKNQSLIGKDLREIGEIFGKDPLEAVMDLLLVEENAVGMVMITTREEEIIRLLGRTEGNICSDGLLLGKPHPRTYGAFPRILGRYVRTGNILRLEQAIRKMTSKPAEVFGIKGRGVLKEGNFADVVIFDPDTICDKGTYIDSMQFPEGIKLVMVNGQIVIEDGICKGIAPGKVLRKM